MAIVLLINAAGGETRVALVENGSITEYYLDRKRDRGIVGNIYKGRVVRVLPGMQAAFVDIGLKRLLSSTSPTSSTIRTSASKSST